jgi:hypothetical protein
MFAVAWFVDVPPTIAAGCSPDNRISGLMSLATLTAINFRRMYFGHGCRVSLLPRGMGCSQNFMLKPH